VAAREGAVILAIDPGPAESGFAILRFGQVRDSGTLRNEDLIARLPAYAAAEDHEAGRYTLAIEMIASYGMAVGREVFETCVWIGRFQQAWHDPEAVRLIYRKDVKMHLCGSPRAKDPNIRQALIDLLGAPGTKAKPGPTYGVRSHAWPALAVAVTAGATA
jgi:hypothetical protein